MLRNWQRWTYYSQWLIAAGAAAQCWQTSHWLRLPPVSIWVFIFVFCSTLLLYLFHFRFYWIKKPVNDRQQFFVRHRKWLLIQFLLGLGGLGISFFKTDVHFLVPIAVLAVCTCAYTYFIFKPRHHGIFKHNGLFKILTLTFVWMAVTSVLPVVASGRAWLTPAFLLYYVMRWLFMLAICLPFDVRDMQQDKLRGNMTLPVWLGKKNTFRLCYVCLMLHVLLPFAGLASNWYDLRIIVTNIAATAVTAYCIYYSSRNLQKEFSWFLLDSNFVLRAAIIGSIVIF